MEPPSAAVVKLIGASATSVVPFALEDRRAASCGRTDRGRRGRAAHARLALAGDANSRALVDPGRNVDVELARLERAALAVARGHGSATVSPEPMQPDSPARPRRSPAAREPCRRRRSWRRLRAAVWPLRSGRVAALAAGQRLDGDRLFHAGERLFQRHLEVIAQVRTARGAGALRARIHELAEDRRENVGKAFEPCRRRRTALPPPPFWNAAWPKRS